MIKIFSLFILSYFIISLSHAQQNTISVKEKNIPKKEVLSGLYYSSFVIEEVRIKNGGTSFHKVRHCIYFINQREVFLFKSKLAPKKISKKIAKKGTAMAEEFGTYTESEGDIYFHVQSINQKHQKTYNYIGQKLKNQLYLNYKAAYKQKTALDIYLYKYDNSVDL